jgi:hypothetical protein
MNDKQCAVRGHPPSVATTTDLRYTRPAPGGRVAGGQPGTSELPWPYTDPSGLVQRALTSAVVRTCVGASHAVRALLDPHDGIPKLATMAAQVRAACDGPQTPTADYARWRKVVAPLPR